MRRRRKKKAKTKCEKTHKVSFLIAIESVRRQLNWMEKETVWEGKRRGREWTADFSLYL